MTASPGLYRHIVLFLLAFLLVRCLVVTLYEGTDYYASMVCRQYAIADAAYRGHSFSYDPVRLDAAWSRTKAQRRLVPIEDWHTLPSSDRFVVPPAQDVPGYGYLIAWTSQVAGGGLTTKYAFALQLFGEFVAVLAFMACVGVAFDARLALATGWVYLLAYPFIWPMLMQPMRDVFALPVYGLGLAGVFLFRAGRGWRFDVAAALCLGLAGLLLWQRPSPAYWFVLLAFGALFIASRSLQARAVFAACLVLLPMVTFTWPLRDFNVRYYGVADTDVIGRGLWEGMGIIPDNPYGFVLDDAALVPWTRKQGSMAAYGSPEMNKLLGEYARGVIMRDPGYYLKTIVVRMGHLASAPLDLVLPASVHVATPSELGLSMREFALERPAAFVFLVARRLAGLAFFYLGLLAAIWCLRGSPGKRVEVLLLLSPFLYTFATQLPLHFEARYFATGTWALVFPLAWMLLHFWHSRKARWV